MNKLHFKTIEGDKAFYYRNVDGNFHGAFLTHIDDFELTGTNDFVEEILEVVEKELTISKVEKDNFRYIGLDVNVISDRIQITLEEYAKSLQSLAEIRKVED